MSKAIVIGASSGGIKMLETLLPALPKDFPIPIFIAIHLSPDAGGYLAQYLNEMSEITVMEAYDQAPIKPNHAYLAPANYHLLVENTETLALCVSEKVSYARPSIDVLFETAADTFRDGLLGIILSGANRDGCKGCLAIKEHGGLVIAMEPSTAVAPIMPQAVIDIGASDYIFSIDEIINYCLDLQCGYT